MTSDGNKYISVQVPLKNKTGEIVYLFYNRTPNISWQILLFTFLTALFIFDAFDITIPIKSPNLGMFFWLRTFPCFTNLYKLLAATFLNAHS